ncbi:MAG: MFS transporter [Kiloniellales bacterium]|nr:MFS transporter [Kiloniellales bacterium]
MAAASGFRNVLRALRHPNYGIYTAGSSVSLIGTWMQRIAVGWLAWELTGSGAWLGAVAFADLFPTVLIGPLAGAAADRWNRLRVIKVSQCLACCQSVTLFVLTATGAMTIELLLLLTLALGVIIAFNQPARLALIPNLVPREDLPAAVAINSVIFNSARFLGPAVAGLLIVSVGVAAAFAANALTFTVFLFALSRIRLQAPASPPSDRDRPLFGDIAEGLRYVAGHPGIAPLLLMMVIVSTCARPFVELLPGFADRVFGSGADGLAIMTSTVGLGAVAGGLWLAQRAGAQGLTRLVLASGLVLGLALLGFVATRALWLAVPALALAGFVMVVGGVGTQTLLQLSLEPDMRGRVMSLYGLIFRGAPAVGALAMGGASDFVGLRLPLAVGAGLTLLACALIWTRRRHLAAALEREPVPAA